MVAIVNSPLRVNAAAEIARRPHRPHVMNQAVAAIVNSLLRVNAAAEIVERRAVAAEVETMVAAVAETMVGVGARPASGGNPDSVASSEAKTLSGLSPGERFVF